MGNIGVSETLLKQSKIAMRMRNTNVILLGAVLLLVIAIANELVISVTNDAAKNFADLYAYEVMGKFDLLVTQQLSLARKVSRSQTVVDWFSDEDNPEKAATAYGDMIDYTGMLENAELYMVIHNSLREYTINNMTSFEDFQPFNRIDSSVPEDSWYGDCTGSGYDYMVQLSAGKAASTQRFWINHKVFNEGNLAGVFCIGIPFREMINGLFSRYDTRNVKGYIIDKKGIVQMDSALEEENTNSITALYDDSMFRSAMENYLNNIDGYFDSNARPAVIKLNENTYSYSSIMPIAGTDWSVVTFFSSNPLYSTDKLWFPLAAIFFALLLYALLSGIAMHRLVFSPLNHLTESLTGEKYNAGAIFGHDRNDEIGELSKTIEKMRECLNSNNREMERLIRIDQLTDIPNRRSFDERLSLEWRRAVREQTLLSIMILDLDLFKDYNDTYGHLQGDRALKTVAKIFMLEVKRSGDFVARWGGEEFIALLTNTDAKGAVDVAEQIRRHIENTLIPLSDDSDSRITVSIGINTIMPVPEDSFEEFIRRADMALYTAKRTGRNKVSCWEGEQYGMGVS